MEMFHINTKHRDTLVEDDINASIIPSLIEIGVKYPLQFNNITDAYTHINMIPYSYGLIVKKVVDSVNTGSSGSSDSKEKKTGILTTRFGTCYYSKELDKYTNIEPYLKWKKLTKEELTDKDIKFISSLPKPVEYLGKKYDLHLGKYGIYLKDKKNNNHKLDKKLWDSYC
jgi:hypothetical protein